MTEKIYERRPPQFTAIFYDGSNAEEVSAWAAKRGRKSEIQITHYRNGDEQPLRSEMLFVDDVSVGPNTWIVWEGKDIGTKFYTERSFRCSFKEAERFKLI